MTKKEKRERKKQDRGIVDFMMITNHFFHHLREWILKMNDPRHPGYITYTQADLSYMAILKNICGQYTTRKMEEYFNQENCLCSTKKTADGMTVRMYYHKVLDTQKDTRQKKLDEGFEWNSFLCESCGISCRPDTGRHDTCRKRTMENRK